MSQYWNNMLYLVISTMRVIVWPWKRRNRHTRVTAGRPCPSSFLLTKDFKTFRVRYSKPGSRNPDKECLFIVRLDHSNPRMPLVNDKNLLGASASGRMCRKKHIARGNFGTRCPFHVDAYFCPTLDSAWRIAIRGPKIRRIWLSGRLGQTRGSQ